MDTFIRTVVIYAFHSHLHDDSYHLVCETLFFRLCYPLEQKRFPLFFSFLVSVPFRYHPSVYIYLLANVATNSSTRFSAKKINIDLYCRNNINEPHVLGCSYFNTKLSWLLCTVCSLTRTLLLLLYWLLLLLASSFTQIASPNLWDSNGSSIECEKRGRRTKTDVHILTTYIYIVLYNAAVSGKIKKLLVFFWCNEISRKRIEFGEAYANERA